MLWLFSGLWAYKAEIILAVQVLAALRKTAQEITRDYIRKKIETKLKRSLAIVGVEIALLLLALYGTTRFPSLGARLAASFILWAVTIYNVLELTLITIPELRALNRTLKSKVGYAVKYILEISLVNELMHLNIVFLVFCLVAGISSRTAIGTAFSYTKPWAELFHPSRHHREHRHGFRPRPPHG